ncbi:cold-shock protein [Nocardia sp. NPDC004340]|uniref:cold-shock protein n=1 Tax=Nocardia sp. CA-136227 TaxID=3239979 RepID=UPI003D952D33
MATGTVIFFNADRGFGMLSQDGGGPDVYVHFSAILGLDPRPIEVGQAVTFDVVQGPKGPQAENVIRR